MFVSAAQLQQSLENLQSLHPFFGTSFLAFKRIALPVGSSTEITFSRVVGEFMENYYRPNATYPGFFTPFHTSDPASRWNKPRYVSTSLQRITVDTFGDALIHPKRSKKWGWRQDYVDVLERHLEGKKIPTFDLAAWLFRDEDLGNAPSTDDLTSLLRERFFINPEEDERLLSDESAPVSEWLQSDRLSEAQLNKLIGSPPGSLAPSEGSALTELRLRGVGPAPELAYEPAPRLNLITGDNSLGKTFILDCIWWAITDTWIGLAASPRDDAAPTSPLITFSFAAENGDPRPARARYEWREQRWIRPQSAPSLAGLAVYSRHDGSFSIWDPALPVVGDETPRIATLTRSEVFYGLSTHNRLICNGLIRDWVKWQTHRFEGVERWEALQECLRALSPIPEEIVPGPPRKLPFNELEFPTLKMRYGIVPVVHASAGVQRTLALAYVLVWSWFRHLDNSASIRSAPHRRLVLLIDEIEAHLHPRWQRTIIPSLVKALGKIMAQVSVQFHVATHSPMVMASTETVFDEERDDLHHLKLVDDSVVLEELAFQKRGRVDYWLMSEVFGLKQPRSLPAETAIEKAKMLQGASRVSREEILQVHQLLLEQLAEDDDFWPRWRFFAEAHGVNS